MPSPMRTAFGVLLVGVLAGSAYWYTQGPAVGATKEYNPPFSADNFVPEVNHKYFTLTPGKKYQYEKKTNAGIERREVTILNEGKKVMGVAVTTIWDKEWLNGALKEDTRDWYAQDKQGNVWYFGEAVANYKDGKLVNYNGTWEAGVNGASPGVIMPADPQVGMTYRQESAKGVAEDMGTVVALGKKVTIRYGTFEGCIQIRDWSLIEKAANEFKYYCPGVAFMVLEELAGPVASLVGESKSELVAVTQP